MEMNTKKGLVRWPRLLIGATMMLFAGVIYAWSILKTPLSEEFGWSASALALNFTLTLSFFCTGGLVGSLLTKRMAPRWALLLAAALVLLGFYLSSRLSGSVLMLYLSYGCFAGLGIGIVYNVVISATNAWFPDQKGLCSGVLMMCFGISSLLLGKVAEALFASAGWRTTYLILGIGIAVILAVFGFGVRPPEQGTALPAPKKVRGGADESFEARDYSTSEMVRRFPFWRFFMFSILTSAVGSSVISFARDLALSVGAAASLATTLVGVLSLCNGLGRVLCGVIFDALGRKKTMVLANLITIAAPLLVLIAVSAKSLPLCIAGLCMTGIAYGCSPTISSAFISAFYGTKHFSSNFSLANMMLVPSAFVATLSNTLLVSTGGFTAPFVMLLIFASLAMGLNLSIRRP